MSRDRKTAWLAGRQEGLLLTAEALEAGWSPATLSRANASGRVERPEPGVVKIGGAPLTWRQSLLAKCLTESGYASHRGSCAVRRLEGFHPTIQDVTVRRWERRPNQ